MHELKIKAVITNYAEYVDLLSAMDTVIEQADLSHEERLAAENTLDRLKDWKPVVAQSIRAEGKEADIL